MLYWRCVTSRLFFYFHRRCTGGATLHISVGGNVGPNEDPRARVGGDEVDANRHVVALVLDAQRALHEVPAHMEILSTVVRHKTFMSADS